MTTSPSFNRSRELFARAEKLMPAGVSSPVRAFRHVGGTPIFMTRGRGAEFWDEDGNRYTDYCLAWGPLILGHANENVIAAVERTLRDGLAFGTCHRFEGDLAERVLEAFPYAERVRFVVSGTEAVMTATRLARAATGRKLLLKFSGCYHGHVDALLVKAGSGVVTQGLADSAGVSDTLAKDTLVLPLGDAQALSDTFAKYGKDIAAAIIEPLPANNGLLVQSKEWLQQLRQITEANGALLIFDEVITGFRFGFHGYAKLIGIEPDLTTLGKIVGGGLPAAAVCGKGKLMDQLAPLGKVYQAGTMAGNPVALAAGIATLDELHNGKVHAHLETLGARLEEKLKGHVPVQRVGSLFWVYFDGVPPHTAEAISSTAIETYKRRYASWIAQGIYLPPSAYEVGFLSAAHSNDHIDALAAALK
jgi:glutamate-1-semialdehyde 2,1-aminomutase